MADWTKSFDEMLDVAPPLAGDQLGRIPAKRGLFALADAAGRAIVLLTAANIRSRLACRLAEPLDEGRTRTVDLRRITRLVLWKLTSSRFETDLAFMEAAMRIWPKSYTDLLASKPAWFVHVDERAEYPHFTRTQDLSAGGRYFGPLPDGRRAGRFVDALREAFDLCRHYAGLRQSPHGRKCAYGQMGRCLSPCDGTVSLADYRRAVGEAADFAAGRREAFRRRLARQMTDAAAELAFERAAAIKARIDHLAEFDGPGCKYVLPLEQFQYVFIQPGPTTHQAQLLLANRGSLDRLGTIDYPLRTRQIDGAVQRLARLAARQPAIAQAETYRIALASRYLFSGPARRGVVLHWSAELSPSRLAEAIESGKAELKIKAPRPGRARGPRKDKDKDKDKATPPQRKDKTMP